jgi:hypothetical protein
MPEEKIANPFPYPTPEEIAAAPGGREIKAARNIAVRKFNGIPMRAFLLGGNDHSPVMQGIVDLTTICYRLLDEFPDEASDNFVQLRAMMENHQCPTSPGQ